MKNAAIESSITSGKRSQRSLLLRPAHPGHRKQGCQSAEHGIIRPAAFMDGQLRFAVLQARQRFAGGFAHILAGQITDQQETGRVGMPRHPLARKAGAQDVDGGMFQRMVAARFDNIRSFKNGIHAFILSPRSIIQRCWVSVMGLARR